MSYLLEELSTRKNITTNYECLYTEDKNIYESDSLLNNIRYIKIDQEIKKDLYYEDKYAWIQKIKDALNEYISKDHAIKSNAMKDSKKDLKSNKPEKSKQTQATSANEIAKQLFEGNTMNKKKKPNKTSGSPAEMAKGLFQQYLILVIMEILKLPQIRINILKQKLLTC